MKKILDYDEMLNILNSFNKNIKKQEPIGKTKFGYEIKHYTYGNGKKNVIITGGTHSAELISIHFILEIMKKLENEEITINQNEYTLHFIPIVNPEGTIIVTSAIRTLIMKEMTEDEEQRICKQYYLNAKLDDIYAEKYNNKYEKLHHLMFQNATYKCIPDKHEQLKENIKSIEENSNLPIGCLIDWSNNGNGIDLNSNVESGRYFNEVKQNESIYMDLRFNTLDLTKKGPIGRPFDGDEFKYEQENIKLLEFYKKLKEKSNVVASFIYHACGGLVYYLEKQEQENPWDKEYNYYEYNKKVAEIYSKVSDYKIIQSHGYTTLDTKLMTIIPGTLLIELSKIRANPLSQFIENTENNKEGYIDTINKNIDALIKTINNL